MFAQSPSLTFFKLLSESNRTIKYHSGHFRTLSLAFFFPLSFSLLFYSTFRSLSFSSSSTATATTTTTTTLSLFFVYAIFLFTTFLSALCTITASAYRASNTKHLSFISSITSLAHSFLRLLVTTLASLIILLLICSIFILFAGIVHKFIITLGYKIDYKSNSFIGSIIILSIICVLVLIFCLANWTLVAAIVVVESKWGFEPLWRSIYLLRGARTISLAKFYYFGSILGFTLWVNSTPLSYQNWWRIMGFILQIVGGSFLATVFMLQNVVANTVLYVECMAVNGEMLPNIDEELAPNYLIFPLLDGELKC